MSTCSSDGKKPQIQDFSELVMLVVDLRDRYKSRDPNSAFAIDLEFCAGDLQYVNNE